LGDFTTACAVADEAPSVTTTASARCGWQSRVGTVTCNCVAVFEVTAAASPAIVTVTADVKPVPVMVAADPSTSVVGAIDVIKMLDALARTTTVAQPLKDALTVEVAQIATPVVAARAVTTPVVLTVAFDASADDHVIVVGPEPVTEATNVTA
jgi:hypothetical protein